MLKYLRSFREATFATKNFWFNVFIYGLAMLVSTIYVYARLNDLHSFTNKNPSHKQ
jgi:hypothetical protein